MPFVRSQVSFALLQKARDYKDDPSASTRYKVVQGLGITSTVFTFLFVCLCFFLRSRIALACGILSESGQALGDMKTLILWPFIPFVMALTYIAWFLIVSVYLFRYFGHTHTLSATLTCSHICGALAYDVALTLTLKLLIRS